MIRLDRFISERTEYTRSRIKELAARGSISLNGTPVRRSDVKIDPESDTVEVCGAVIGSQRYRYILLNKPAGYVSSTSEHDGKNVMELVPPQMRTKAMFPAGRLDKDSLGALLITDDGELSHRLLSPVSHIPKIYIVKLDRPFQNKYVDIFKKGIEIGGGETCLPARVRQAENADNMAFVELYEGKFHQVKRMFSAVENCVEKLMRISYGNLILPETLGIGSCMELLHKDVEKMLDEPDFDRICTDFSDIFSAILINN
ncbi:MAG: rRNA pseudouridine synthase [Ruminococcus sp.]|nr:rRNA pseudouridine synthase [Ruminococcus sp.]